MSSSALCFVVDSCGHWMVPSDFVHFTASLDTSSINVTPAGEHMSENRHKSSAEQHSAPRNKDGNANGFVSNSMSCMCQVREQSAQQSTSV
jgi:hypothetical protein